MKKYIKWLFVILWMLLIFQFSNESGIESTETSQFFVMKTKLLLQNYLPWVSFDFMTLIVRKSAHFFLYFVLGILVTNASNGMNRYCVISLLLCLFYACTDEFHQLFIIGRSGELKDVLVDFIGSSTGILCFWLFQKKFYADK